MAHDVIFATTAKSILVFPKQQNVESFGRIIQLVNRHKNKSLKRLEKVENGLIKTFKKK